MKTAMEKTTSNIEYAKITVYDETHRRVKLMAAKMGLPVTQLMVAIVDNFEGKKTPQQCKLHGN